MSHFKEDEFVAEWDVFAADDEEEEEDERDFAHDSFSVGTDGSPVDVMGFPVMTASAKDTTSTRRSSKLEQRIDQDVAVSSTHQQRQRRNVSRLPRKSRSLDEAGKANLRNDLRRSMSGTGEHISRGGRRKSTSFTVDSAAHSSGSEERRRGPRSSMRRGVTPEEHQAPSTRASKTKGPRKSLQPSGSSSSRPETTAERAQRLRNLALAYQGAKVLEKTVVAQTEHLKKDVPM